MRRLSNRALWLVDRLYKLDRQSTWFGRYRQRSEITTHLTELAIYKEAASIPCVCRFLFFKDRGVRQAAQGAIGGILSGLDPIELLQLPDAFGWEYGWYVGSTWNNLTPADVRNLGNICAKDISVSILGLLSFHRSGYVREEAVKRLAKVTDGMELPFLLIRQNDWVAKVSNLARAAVQARLESGYIKYLANSIDVVAHLPEFGRNDVTSITDAVFTQLLNPENDDRLRLLIKSGNQVTVRRFVKRGFELSGQHHERLSRYGIESEDVVVRLWSARQLLSAAYDGDLADKLLGDGFAPIRRAAFEAKAQQQPDIAVEVWKRAALDPSSGIRDLGRYYLREAAEIDIHQLYCHELSAQPYNLSALAGLSECATEDDIGLLHQYLQHSYPSRRRVAIAGLARVLGVRIVDELLELLTDESPSVARQAARSLEDFASDIDGVRLFGVLQSSQNDAGKKAIVRLIYEMGKWKSLPWLIRSAGLGDALVCEQASADAYSWLMSNSVYTKPSEAQQKAIILACDEVDHAIPSSLLDQLRRLLPFALTTKAMVQGSAGDQNLSST